MGKRSTRTSARIESATTDLTTTSKRFRLLPAFGDGRPWLNDIGFIITEQIHNLPCLRSLFCVNKAFNKFSKQRFVKINREMEVNITKDVEHIFQVGTASLLGTIVFDLLQTVTMRETVLWSDRELRLEVSSIFVATRKAQLRLRALECDLRLIHGELGSRATSATRATKSTTNQALLQYDTVRLRHSQACQELQDVSHSLRAALRRARMRLKRNTRKIDRFARELWSRAAALCGNPVIADLRAAIRRVDAALADRARMGARSRCRIALIPADAEGDADGGGAVAVSFTLDGP